MTDFSLLLNTFVSFFFRAGYLASRYQSTSTLRTGRSLLELFGQECKDSQHLSTAIGRRQPYWLKYKIARRLQWSEGSRLKYPIFGTGRSMLIAVTMIERQPRKSGRVRNFHPDQHQSLQRSSLASIQIHLEECSLPYQRLHKVRKEQVQAELEYPLR